MRILLVGAGGVGDAIAKIAARRDFFETMIVSDYVPSRAERTIAWIEAKHGPQGGRFVGVGGESRPRRVHRRAVRRGRGGLAHVGRRDNAGVVDDTCARGGQHQRRGTGHHRNDTHRPGHGRQPISGRSGAHP